MTHYELNFSLLVEHMLSKIVDPAYRQIMVEVSTHPAYRDIMVEVSTQALLSVMSMTVGGTFSMKDLRLVHLSIRCFRASWL